MIQIKYDCPESVDLMPKTDCGIYCGSCARNIYDFRGKSLDEIAKIRTSNPEISCGVFDSQTASSDTRTTVQNVFRIAFAAIFILGFNVLTLFGQSPENYDDSVKYSEIVSQKAIIIGSITNHHGRPMIANITYTIEGEQSVSIETLKDGLFEFELSPEHLTKKVYISVVADGFYSKYLTIDKLTNKCHIFEVQLVKAKKPRGRNKHISGMIAGKF